MCSKLDCHNNDLGTSWTPDGIRKGYIIFGCFQILATFTVLFSTLLSHTYKMPRLQAIHHSPRWTFSTCGIWVWLVLPFFFDPALFQRKTAPVFEHAKTSGCTLANHVILRRIYPNKARSNTIPLWLPNGLGIIHLDPYNNTGSLWAIFRFPRFPCRIQHLVVESRLSHSAVFVCAGNICTDFGVR